MHSGLPCLESAARRRKHAVPKQDKQMQRADFPATAAAAPLPTAGAQRRHVTFLFADLVGSSTLSERLEPEVFHALIDQWLQAMLEEIERYGGTLNQFSGDGLLVLFGAPLAQEDAPLQACRAALAMQRRLSRLESVVRLAMRLGIDSGEIVAGVVGGDRRSEYAALGQRTNRAKRIQEQAEPGSILISQDTHDLVREFFRLLPAGEFVAKGLATPVRGFRLLEEKGKGEVSRLTATMARWHSPFVGRGEPMARLTAALDRAAQGHGQQVAIVGDAGVGKSRLLYELAARATQQGFQVHEGRCTMLRRHVPYAPYADILRSWCGIRSDDSPQQTASKIAAQFDAEAHYLREIVNGAVAPPATSGLDADARMLATQSAFERVVRAQASRQPMLLVLDDVHWMDPLSRQLTENLARLCEGEAMLVCTAVRSHALESTGEAPAAIVLEPLSLPEIQEMTATLRGLDAVAGEQFAIWLERQSGGLPLFVEELLLALQAAGALRQEGTGWTLTRDPGQEPLPASVQDLIAARIDRLPELQLALLQQASVLGQTFSQNHLATLAGTTAAAATELEELSRQGFLQLDAASSSGRFNSALTQRVVYRTMDRGTRSALHLRIAESIASRTAPLIDDAVLAHHFHQGGAIGQALLHLRRAAGQAEWAFANADAVALLSQVLDIGAATLSPAEQADLRIQRGRLRVTFLGDAEGQADINEALVLAEGSKDVGVYVRALLAKGIVLYRCFHFEESLQWLEKATAEAQQAGATELQIEALLQRAFVLSERQISGNATTAGAPDARPCCEQALALSRELGNRGLEVQSLHSLGTTYLQELDYDHAQQVFVTCVEEAKALCDRVTQALALQSLARVQQFRFDFDSAIPTILELQGLLRELGDRRRLTFSKFNLAAAYLGSGQREAARAAAEEALPEAERLGLDYLLKLTLRFLRGLYSEPQLLAARIATCAHLCRLLSSESEQAERADLLIDLAAAYAEAGDKENERATLAESVKLDIDLANYTRAQTSLQRLGLRGSAS